MSIIPKLRDPGASLLAHRVENLPAMWKTRVQSLGWKDFLEKGMATHSSILAWRISQTEKPCRLQSMGYQRTGHDWGNACILPMSYYLTFSSIFMTSLWTTSLYKKYHFITLNKSQKMLWYTQNTQQSLVFVPKSTQNTHSLLAKNKQKFQQQ